MAEGELGAVFKGLAKDADEAAASITESVAKVAEETADLEDANLAKVLDADAKAAKDLEAAGAKGGDPAGATPGGAGASPFAGMSDADLIGGRGANVGRPGSGPKVRELATEGELQDYFDALIRNGSTDVTPPGFPGRIVETPDGTIINWRTQSKTTGSVPTVDVNPGNGQNFKVHVNPNGW